MLRVCHVISGDLWAGAEVMAFNLLRRLKEVPDLDLHTVLLNEGPLAEGLRTVGVPVHVLDERRISFPRLLREMRVCMREKSPQIIHSHRYKENIIAFLSCNAAAWGARLVATQHGLPEPTSGRPGPAALLVGKLNKHILARHFDRVVGVSLDIRNYFVDQRGFAVQRVRVIRNGIELPELQTRELSDMPVVGSAGRLYPVKDYPLMVEIARVVAEKGALRFELAGEGPERDPLKGLVAARGLGDSFRFHGHLSDMAGFYRGLDIYLSTSLHEGIPMSILEAMAWGLPVVAPRVGGIGEIIEDGIEGFLVMGRRPEDFAEKCLLLRNAELRKRMGEAARKKIDGFFSAGHMASQYHQLYRDLLS